MRQQRQSRRRSIKSRILFCYYDFLFLWLIAIHLGYDWRCVVCCCVRGHETNTNTNTNTNVNTGTLWQTTNLPTTKTTTAFNLATAPPPPPPPPPTSRYTNTKYPNKKAPQPPTFTRKDDDKGTTNTNNTTATIKNNDKEDNTGTIITLPKVGTPLTLRLYGYGYEDSKGKKQQKIVKNRDIIVQQQKRQRISPKEKSTPTTATTTFLPFTNRTVDASPLSKTLNKSILQAAAVALHSKQRLQQYQKRKQVWADRYTSLQALREAFGVNKHWYGDLDAASARKLYKTLLPTALLELVQVGVQPEELAPFAYQARVAAKLYARERCRIPSRVMAQLFDGIRTLRKYGRFQPVGMSYEQIWEKYQTQVLLDLEEDATDDQHQPIDVNLAIHHICLKILESSCRTNSNVDKWVLSSTDANAGRDIDPIQQESSQELQRIAQTLKQDVINLLHPTVMSSSVHGHNHEHGHDHDKKSKLRLIWSWITKHIYSNTDSSS